MEFLTRLTVENCKVPCDRFVTGQAGARQGKAVRVAGAHHHTIHTGQHGSVQGIDQGSFDLVQEINEDQAIMPFPGQPNLGKTASDEELDSFRVQVQGGTFGLI